jgi:hypothetical protein
VKKTILFSFMIVRFRCIEKAFKRMKMKIRFSCPKCGFTYTSDSVNTGRECRCRKCGFIFIWASPQQKILKRQLFNKIRSWISKHPEGVIVSFISILFIYGPILMLQSSALSRAEKQIKESVGLIKEGCLIKADSTLQRSDKEAKGWSAWPSISTRRKKLSVQLKNTRKAYQDHFELIEKITVELALNLKSARFNEAVSIADSAINGDLKHDQTMRALSFMMERLQAQDFKGASDAAYHSIILLSSLVPIDEETRTALPDLQAAVEKERSANRAAQERIAADVRSLINFAGSRESSQFKPILRGKAMIWDATKDQVEMAYELLPDDLRASSRENSVTIFSIIRRENILQGYYSVSNQPGYKEKMIIGVVYWPQRTSAGSAIVWGGDPPFSRPVSYTPGYGSSVNIKDWIISLPRE